MLPAVCCHQNPMNQPQLFQPIPTYLQDRQGQVFFVFLCLSLLKEVSGLYTLVCCIHHMPKYSGTQFFMQAIYASCVKMRRFAVVENYLANLMDSQDSTCSNLLSHTIQRLFSLTQNTIGILPLLQASTLCIFQSMHSNALRHATNFCLPPLRQDSAYPFFFLAIIPRLKFSFVLQYHFPNKCRLTQISTTHSSTSQLSRALLQELVCIR